MKFFIVTFFVVIFYVFCCMPRHSAEVIEQGNGSEAEEPQSSEEDHVNKWKELVAGQRMLVTKCTKLLANYEEALEKKQGELDTCKGLLNAFTALGQQRGAGTDAPPMP